MELLENSTQYLFNKYLYFELIIHIDIETLYAQDVWLLIKPNYFTMHIQNKNFILSVSMRSYIYLVRCFH